MKSNMKSKSSKLTKSVRKTATKQQSLSKAPGTGLSLGETKKSFRGHGDGRKYYGMNDQPFAPAAVSMNAGTRHAVTHLPSEAGHHRVRFNAPLADIFRPNTAAVSQYPGLRLDAFDGSTNAYDFFGTISLNPTRGLGWQKTIDAAPGYASDVYPGSMAMALTGLTYARYRTGNKCRLYYEPNGSTASTDSFVLAVSTDPCHPLIGLMQYDNVPANYDTLASVDNFVTFSSWAPWSMEFALDSSKEYYTYMHSLAAAAITDIRASNSLIRETCFGAVSCLCSSQSSALVYGKLMIEFECDFFDPSPWLSLAQLPFRSLLSGTLAAREPKCESKDEKKIRDVSDRLLSLAIDKPLPTTEPNSDDEFNIPPPAFAGAPSATPSGVREKLLNSVRPTSLLPAALATVPAKRSGGWLSS